MKEKTIIIGGGLTGLTIAYFLEKNGMDYHLLEARDRLGGRILTIKGDKNTTLEMGATWFGKKHKHLVDFLDSLKIEYFQQYLEGVSFFRTMSFTAPQAFEVPAAQEPSFRIKGGTFELIEQLKNKIDNSKVTLNSSVKTIEQMDNHLNIILNNGNIVQAKKVVSTLPPKLLNSSVQFIPAFPETMVDIFQNTQTWMESSIKFAIEYDRAFWREKGWSGAIFSQSDIIPEMYDHSSFDGKTFALKGFLNGSMIQYPKAQREEKVIKCLFDFLGKEAQNYIQYYDKIWEKEPQTFSPSQQFIPAHKNNGHQVFQKTYWENRLFFAGTETSPNFGGYMEGAIQSAKNVVDKLTNS